MRNDNIALSEEEKHEIIVLASTGLGTMNDLARVYGVSRTEIATVLKEAIR